nr:Chain A, TRANSMEMBRANE PROTEIN TMP21 PRECURSOR [unidentified]1P23_B Chain B, TRANSMEMBRANE PROTEIN TMP21 PRECURSOR [unidentified]1P23_C Chain C, TRANSMEMBRANE PROTEIN TMP21 PRECURSOR [unidentified]1P23_D Chain D, TRANSMEMBRANE PROTEIN TMP21 PRECURSOR [unidentified]
CYLRRFFKAKKLIE